MGVRHGQLLRCVVEDVDGRLIGQVLETAPRDGSGDPEMIRVQMAGPLARHRWIPVADSLWMPGYIRVPVSRRAIEDAPCAEDRRWGDPEDVAKAHWLLAVD